MKKVPLEQDKIRNFPEILNVAKDLGFKVVTTGGNFITHEILNCSFDDYEVIYDLANPSASKYP